MKTRTKGGSRAAALAPLHALIDTVHPVHNPPPWPLETKPHSKFHKCAHALHQFQQHTDGTPLPLPSQALPPML